MASTTSLNSLHQPFLHHHSFPTSQKHSFNLPFNNLSSPTITNNNSLLTTSSSILTPTTSTTSSFDALSTYLSSNDFRQADEETRRLLIALAGENAVKRGYVFFSEVKFISPTDLQCIDSLWRSHSNNRFGYSVQKRIWEKKAKKDFTQFFIKVGWMRKLDTEVVQWNYRSFPTEFTWELKDDSPPEGHLPLTNALRGTQLLTSILTHPAFEGEEGESEDGGNDGDESSLEKPKLIMGGNRSLKSDYSF